ncbi:MAG: galactokinase [bacterium]|nr:galactokinase [bacterium]
MNPIVVQAQVAFEQGFSGEPDVLVQAPGRVNLIGEHTDYNAGFVFPAAIDRWVVFAARKREDGRAVIRSVAHEDEISFGVNEPLEPEKNWGDYAKGVVREFQKLGESLGGFDAVLVGDVPVGAGLSSSAAVEMAVGKGILELNGLDMSGPDLALLGQRAENQFVGVNCGIMDQFVSANARAGHALFLDCRDLSFEQVPLTKEGVRIVICNSGVTRGLTNSAYNDRRSSCENGAEHMALATGQDIQALRDVTLDMLDVYRGALSETVLRRCRHVIAEIERTRKAVDLLKAGDLEGFGGLMADSHASLRDDYEVSGKELDLLVEIAQDVPGVYGARRTGAGFGGCTVNLVREEAVEDLVAAMESRYEKETHLKPEMYICTAVNGAECVQ